MIYSIVKFGVQACLHSESKCVAQYFVAIFCPLSAALDILTHVSMDLYSNKVWSIEIEKTT